MYPIDLRILWTSTTPPSDFWDPHVDTDIFKYVSVTFRLLHARYIEWGRSAHRSAFPMCQPPESTERTCKWKSRIFHCVATHIFHQPNRLHFPIYTFRITTQRNEMNRKRGHSLFASFEWVTKAKPKKKSWLRFTSLSTLSFKSHCVPSAKALDVVFVVVELLSLRGRIYVHIWMGVAIFSHSLVRSFASLLHSSAAEFNDPNRMEAYFISIRSKPTATRSPSCACNFLNVLLLEATKRIISPFFYFYSFCSFSFCCVVFRLK